MDRTVQDLRDRIANLTVQRDALASTICDLKREVDVWRYRFGQSEKIANRLERERDAATRRAEVAGDDRYVCYRCGAFPLSRCCCKGRDFDVTI